MTFGEVVIENCHEAIITKEQFEMTRIMRDKKKDVYGMTAFKSKYLLTGITFCGQCGARYGTRNAGKGYNYYACYSRSSSMPYIVKDPTCQNKIWRMAELESIVDAQVRVVLNSPEMAKEIAVSKQTKPTPDNKNKQIEKRLHEIDKQINKFMELYQRDDIPTDILGENINKLYLEKTALEKTIKPEPDDSLMSFDLAEELLKDAAQVWDFADTDQKRRILQSLINRIVLDGDNVKIEWAF
jgi:site-specific DNA recombinase